MQADFSRAAMLTSLTLPMTPFPTSYPSVFAYLQGKVAGLQISTNGSNASLSWRGGSPSLYVNEMPTDVNQLEYYVYVRCSICQSISSTIYGWL